METRLQDCLSINFSASFTTLSKSRKSLLISDNLNHTKSYSSADNKNLHLKRIDHNLVTTNDILKTVTHLVTGTDMVKKKTLCGGIGGVRVDTRQRGEARREARRGARRERSCTRLRGDSRIIMIMQAEQMLSPLSALVTQLN